ncbi:MAG: M23 family metallopeptidase [Pseudomonadales bacterium]
MELIELIKQFSRKQYLVVSHYPRDHTYIAGALCGLILVLLVLPLGGDADGDNGRTEIVLDINLSPELAQPVDTEQKQPDALALSDFVITPHAKSQIEVQPIVENVTLWRNIEVKSGDNLSAIFSKVGLSDQDLFRVLNSSDEAKVLNQVYPGYQLDFLIPPEGELEQLRLLKSPLEGFLFTLNNNNYDVESILNFPQLRPTFKVGTIADSLFMAGQREQIPAVTIMEMANIFGGVIDFILDPRAGDDFSILYDEKYLDGDFIGHGDILATQYTNQGKTFTAVRYINEEGEAGYYNAEGESMRKAFLRSPLDVFRISSNFNPSRRHPILNTIRAHKGTDYAAPRGTPIRATSDGQVTRASRNGSFGNLVIVKHAGGFETKYAHLSKYANGVKKGKRVRQGDIIGYVGTTGSATGPHLHYEFLMGGVHQNPRTIIDKLPKAESIDPAQMDSFRTQTADLLKRFSELNGTTLITLNQPSAD